MSYGRRESFKCIETGEVFNTKKSAADALNISVSSVQDSLRDGSSHMGFTFRYLSDLFLGQYNSVSHPQGVWKDVPGYEGLYQVSDRGEVWSCSRIVNRTSGRPNPIPGKLLSVSLSNSGYCSVALTDRSHITKGVLLHRLVALTFIPNPENKKEVNHKDGNKLNNCVDNLEWATRTENQRHAISFGLSPISSGHMMKMCIKAREVNCKPVYCKTNGITYSSRQAASHALNLGADYILDSIRTGRPHKGYIFEEVQNG